MSYLVYLNKTQREKMDFDHPLLNRCPLMDEEQMQGLLDGYKENPQAHVRDEVIQGNMLLVANLVGRFLFYWPETRRFEEDIVSEGLLGLVEGFDAFVEQGGGTVKELRSMSVVLVKKKIRYYMNDMAGTFGAPLTTNERRVRNGEPLQRTYAQSLPDNISDDAIDPFDVVDALDAYQALLECDGEEVVDLVMIALEHRHDILESDLSTSEKELIRKLASIDGDN